MPKSRPSFFKILLQEFTLHLRLPPNFIHKYGEILPENIRLRSSSGEIWNVKVDQADDKTYRFGEGWNKFAVDAALQFGEFVVFFLNDDNFTFDVTVFGHTSCDRRIIRRRRSASNDVVKPSDGDEVPPRMKLTMKEYQRAKVLLSKDFVEVTGLKKRKRVMLQFHPHRQRWPVKVIRYDTRWGTRIFLSKGWTDFRSRNGLLFGKTYLLEYVADEKLIQVKLLK